MTAAGTVLHNAKTAHLISNNFELHHHYQAKKNTTFMCNCTLLTEERQTVQSLANAAFNKLIFYWKVMYIMCIHLDDKTMIAFILNKGC